MSTTFGLVEHHLPGKDDEPSTLVIVTDSAELSGTIAVYLEAKMKPRPETFYLSYQNRGLRGELLTNADLVILGLSRCYGYRVRAEGVMSASSLADHGRPFLVVSGRIECENVSRVTYWDLGCKDSLASRVSMVLSAEVDWPSEARALRVSFAHACFDAPSRHRSI